MSAPIDAQYREQMNAVARGLDAIFNPGLPMGEQTVGFVLLTFEIGKTEGGRVNYIGNADRLTVITAMKEWLARAEGRHQEGGRA